jgi:transcriptional regulator with XRE-family HTH domain
MNTTVAPYTMQLRSRKDRFKYLRGKKDLQQTQVAQMLDLPRSTYIHYESGVIDEIPPHVMEGLINIFGTSEEFILHGRDSSEAFVPAGQLADKSNKVPETKEQREIRALRDALAEAKKERALIEQIRNKERELYRESLKANDQEHQAREKALKAEIEILKLQLGGQLGQ